MSGEQIQIASSNPGAGSGSEQEEQFRDIHAVGPSNYSRGRGWDSSSSSEATNSSENFTTISREFNALVLAGSNLAAPSEGAPLEMIEEDSNNPLAIVLDRQPLPVPEVVSVQRVKKEEAEAKIAAWQNAKVAKINNRFKREDALITGWENQQVQKSTSWMNNIQRKLEEKRAKAMEKMENDIAKAHRKAAERKASAESKRGTKIARVLEVANLMRAIGKPPSKRSFF